MSRTSRSDLFASARDALAKGRNIVEHLTRTFNADRSIAIEIAYSLQSGTYTAFASSEIAKATRLEGHRLLEPVIRDLEIKTVLDCGAGEGTRWFDFNEPVQKLVLLDASFHRLLFAQRNIQQISSIQSSEFVKANMLSLPFADGSFDLVFTSHAVEPNRDEDASRIIARMFSVARKAVVLFEPNYRDAPPEMQARMKKHGYAKNIWDAAHAQPGFKCVQEGNFEFSPNPDNATSYMIFRRETPIEGRGESLVSPTDHRPMSPFSAGFIDDAHCLAFPMLSGIACLAPEDSIFVGHNPDVALDDFS